MIRIDFIMASTAAEACSWMTDESAELALLTTWTCDLQSQMMMAEAHDEMEDGFFEGGILCLEGATMGARESMPIMDKVFLAENYQTGTAILDSTSNRTICEDLEVCWANGGKGLKQKVSLLRL